MLFPIGEHVFDLSLLVHLPFIYHLKILMNLICSFVSLVWTSHKCLLGVSLLLKAFPVPRKTRMLHYSSNNVVTTPPYTHIYISVLGIKPRPSHMSSTASLQSTPGQPPCSQPRFPCWRAACVYYKTALI